jgi:hypothetical protein
MPGPWDAAADTIRLAAGCATIWTSSSDLNPIGESLRFPTASEVGLLLLWVAIVVTPLLDRLGAPPLEAA